MGLVVSKGDELDVTQAYFGQALEEKRKSELIPLEEYEKQYILEVLSIQKEPSTVPKGLLSYWD